jgi:hypothetical protein
MVEEKTKKSGRTIALSGFIGFVLVALLVGMMIGGYLALFVIAPQMQTLQQGNNNQGVTGNQNSNNPNINNNPGITSDPNSQNNQNSFNNPGNTGNPNNNYPNNNTYQGTNINQTSNNQNSNSTQGINNNNPAPTNPTGQYSSTGCQFNLNIPVNGTQASGTISASVNCVVQQNGNNIQLALTITPTTVPASLNQAVGNSPVTFNFAGTTSGSQINANAVGNTGPNGNFDFNLSGSIVSNKLTLAITPASNSQLFVSTPQPIILQSI